MKRNAFGFIHILFALMCAVWLLLPVVLYQLLGSEMLLAGSLFSYLYLFMLILIMGFHTGHIHYLVKRNEGKEISDEQGAYIMATLTNRFDIGKNPLP